jgi:1-acyl-sn-glycerol-3-phosphate acyltransferase
MTKLFLIVRSVLWHLWTFTALVPLAIALLVSSPFMGWRFLYRFGQWWTLWSIYGLKWICGVNWRITGADNLPTDGSATILLSKHQSAWETLSYLALSPEPLCFVYKKELHWVPFFGWAIARIQMIHIDRAQRAQAFKKVVEQGKRVMQENRWVIMFPEGTRIARGLVGQYKAGGTRLACETGAQVVPIAVTSAQCWPRNSFIKYPGTIDISIGQPIASKDHTPESLMQGVQTWIESEMLRLDPPAK